MRLFFILLKFTFLLFLRLPRTTLFPYTTLFRSPSSFVVSESPTAWTILLQALASAMPEDRKSTRLNSSHVAISYAVFCLEKKTACIVATTIDNQQERTVMLLNNEMVLDMMHNNT